MTDRLYAIDVISFAKPSHDPALYDAVTRSAYERGFEAMRQIALNAVYPKKRYGDLDAKDYKWEKATDLGED